MIKIKDDFDLDKLIGFEKNGTYRVFIADNCVIEVDNERNISFSTLECESTEIPSMLYNLFKMGIIEEVRE